MKFSLRTKLSVSYVLLATICIVSISFFSNLFLEKHFREYVLQNQEERYREILASVSRQYENNGEWKEAGIENIGIHALEQGMIMKVLDVSGDVIWDARVYNNGACKEILSNMAKRMAKYHPDFEGEYVEKSFSITKDSENVGSVVIGHYGPYYFNEHDMMFIDTLNKVILSIGAFSLLFALGFGAFMAKRLIKPIQFVIDTAHKISKGFYNTKCNTDSNTKEISQLTYTINHLAEVLEVQESLRQRLTEDVAHELRTPLATLQSHLEAMIDGIWKLDVERLKCCHDETMRLNRLIGDLEKLAQCESESLLLDYTTFDIGELAERTIVNFQHDYLQKGVEISFQGNKEVITADKDKISQAIINLISNALKYTNTGGRVNVTVRGSEAYVSIAVADTGIGISRENLPLIFERFYRVEKSRNRLTGGSGIGLTITKAIVDAHKGTIDVKSQLDIGTQITITIPRRPSNMNSL